MRFPKLFLAVGVAALVLLGACDDDKKDTTTPGDTPTLETTEAVEDTPTVEVAAGAFEQFSAFAGDWTGSWTNTTFGSTGDVTASGTVSEDGTGAGSVDIGGLVFGAVDPDDKNFSATYDGDILTIAVTGDDVFGDVTITVSADGQLTMEATNVPDEGIDTVTGEGTITADQIDVTYTVTFTDGTTAEGTATLTR